MAIIATDSFALYSSAIDMAIGGWIVTNPDVIAVLPTGGVDGNPGIKFTFDGSSVNAIENTDSFLHYGDILLPITGSTTNVIGFTINFSSFHNVTTGSSQCAILEILGSDWAYQHISIKIDGDGKLWVTRINNTDVGSYQLALNHDYHFEIKGVINGSTGSIELRIDGSEVISAENVDTLDSGTTTYNLRIGSHFYNSEYVPDGLEYTVSNFYVLDDSAGVTNFQGKLARVEYVPVNAEGTTIQFAPSAGADNSLMVDEVGAHDYDSTRNVNSVVGEKDTLEVAALSAPTNGEIIGLNVKMVANKDDASARTVNIIQLHNAVEEDGAAVTLAETYALYNTIFETNPDTALQWQKSEFGTLQIGYKNAT